MTNTFATHHYRRAIYIVTRSRRARHSMACHTGHTPGKQQQLSVPVSANDIDCCVVVCSHWLLALINEKTQSKHEQAGQTADSQAVHFAESVIYCNITISGTVSTRAECEPSRWPHVTGEHTILAVSLCRDFGCRTKRLLLAGQCRTATRLAPCVSAKHVDVSILVPVRFQFYEPHKFAGAFAKRRAGIAQPSLKPPIVARCSLFPGKPAN